MVNGLDKIHKAQAIVFATGILISYVLFMGTAIYMSIKSDKEEKLKNSKLEQKTQNEIVINSEKADITNYQSSFNYTDYFNKTHQ